MRKLLSIFVLLAVAATAAAQTEEPVYRYKDANGVIHYTDKPPNKEAKPATLPHLQTYQSQPASAKAKAAATKAAAAKPSAPATGIPVDPGFSVSIESPTPDQTIRDVNSDIAVSVSVMPGLVNGYGLVYALDGAVQNDTPTQDTAYSLKPAVRGTHTISVALVGPENKPVASSSVEIHVMPPQARE